MNKPGTATRNIVVALLLVAAAMVGGGIWGFKLWKEVRQAELEAAYRKFLGDPSPVIFDRYYDYQGVFTDTVERFRFDGADQKLVDQLVRSRGLSRISMEPLESSFRAPRWWRLPDSAVCYLRGQGHQYTMLIHQPETGRVFFEITQD